MHLDITTDAWYQSSPSVANGRLSSACPRRLALRPRRGGLDPKDPIEQRTIRDGGRAQHSSGHFNKGPKREPDIGPRGVVRVERQTTQLRDAVDGDHGGAMGWESAYFQMTTAFCQE